MTPERWQRQKAVFSQVQSASPEERIRLLDVLCAGDQAFRKEIDELLAHHDQDDPFIDNGIAPANLKPGDVLANRFELLRLAGEGGMGQVWAAHDRQLDENIAIKTIHERIAGDDASIDRFKRELQLARRIAHPNVCKLYDLFDDNGRLFLTMELLEGETLTARLKRERRIQPIEALDWMRQLCAGLDAAHTAEVIHRDLKPGNIMLASTRSGAERIVITDFGLARATAAAGAMASLSASGLVVGTPDYMAPEQIRGDPASPATDLYALGLIFFEMLKGERPFAGKNTLDSWMRRIREGPGKLASEIDGLPPQADDVIARCLSFDPAERFASATELWQALETTPKREWRVPKIPVKWLAGAAAAGVAAWLFLGQSTGPSREALLWYQDARRDLAEGAALRASNQLERALKASPQFPAAHAALAEAQLELDQYSQARESILRASSQASNTSRADRAHIEAVSRLLLRDCPAAIAAFQQNVSAVDSAARPIAMVSLARAQERCEKYDDARATLNEAAKLDPRNAAVLVRSALLANRKQAFAESAKLLNDAESIYRERANFEGVTEVLLTKGTFDNTRDKLDEATKELDEAMRLAKTTNSVAQQIRILFQQSNVARRRGTLTLARELADQSLQLARQNNLETLALQGIFAAANIHTIKNENNDAVAELQKALDIATRHRDEENQARANLSLAIAFDRLLLPAEASSSVDLAVQYYERTHHRVNLATGRYLMASLLMREARFLSASKLFRTVRDLAIENGDSNLELLANQNLATCLVEILAFDEADQTSARSLDVARTSKRPRSLAYAHIGRAEILSSLGKIAEAADEIGAARKLVGALEPAASTAPRKSLDVTEFRLALRNGRFDAIRNRKELERRSSDSPALQLDMLAIRCEGYLLLGSVGGATTSCEELQAMTARTNNLHQKVRAMVLRGELLMAMKREPAATEQIDEALHLVDGAEAPYLVEMAKVTRRFALPESQSKAILSQSVSAFRLKLGDAAFERWSRRADVSMRLGGETKH